MPEDRPFFLLVIGAHPGDCGFGAGGLAALCCRAGHTVTFASVTNGDAGHHLEGGGPLAHRRREETQVVARLMGIGYLVLDHHDRPLEPRIAVPDLTQQIGEQARERGLLPLKAELYASVIRVRVPLTATPEDVGEGLERLEQTLDAAGFISQKEAAL